MNELISNFDDNVKWPFCKNKKKKPRIINANML